MNVIFLDFDGVIDTAHLYSFEEVEKKIQILSKICSKYDCKVVIEAACKGAIDEETLEAEGDWVNLVFFLFKKYNIECIGRTPTVKKRKNDYVYTPIWKEDEIRLYLFRHPEIEHYCVIDDDDLRPDRSDLVKVEDHLVRTEFFCDNPEDEGLLEKHEEDIGKILKKENNIRKLVLKRKKNK